VAGVLSLSGIEVTTLPQRTEFYVGQTGFSTYGMVVTATYSDGSTRNVTRSCSFGYGASVDRSLDIFTAGPQVVTVTYTESGITATTSFVVNIIYRELRSVRITIEPSTVEQWTAFIIRVRADYADNSSSWLDYNVSGYTITWNTMHSFTVSYTESGITRTASHTLAPVYWPWVENVLKPFG